VDAVPERRPPALADPRPAPLGVEVADRPEPQRLAHRDLWHAECTRLKQPVRTAPTRTVAVLEDHVHRAGAVAFGVGDRIQLGQAEHRRLLQQHRMTRGQHRERDLGVRARRGGHRDEVGVLVGEQRLDAGIRRRTELLRERDGLVEDDVRDPDEVGLPGCGVGAGVVGADVPAADDGDLQGCVTGWAHSAAPRRVAFSCATRASRIVSKVCACGTAVSVRLRTSFTKSA